MRRLVLCALLALSLGGCANLSNSGGERDGKLVTRGKIDDPRTKHYRCLKSHHLVVSKPSKTEIQVGRPGVGPLIVFLPTPGAAQEAAIKGSAQAAEVIGSGLLYPNQASDKELTVVENCAAKGVTG